MAEDDHTGRDPDVDALIDHNIRLLYNGLVEEGLPERFEKLLALIRAEDQPTDPEDPA